MSKNFKLSNRKRKLLTKEFLQTFKEELIKVFSEFDLKDNRIVDYENESYYGFYGEIVGTSGFYSALKKTCERYNVTKAIYKYLKNLEWEDSDYFEDEIIVEMVNKNIIPLNRKEDNIPIIQDNFKVMNSKYKSIKYYNGYNVIHYGYWFSEDKENFIEKYKTKNQEIIWLN